MADAESVVGVRVKKKFPGFGWHEGTVVECQEAGVFVAWDDGDSTRLSFQVFAKCRSDRKEQGATGVEGRKATRSRQSPEGAVPASETQATRRRKRATSPPSAPRRRTCSTAAPSAADSLWPCGSDWRPKPTDGTRNPEYHGCGKCRWRPSGCRGCIAADAERVRDRTSPPLPRGVVLLPSLDVIKALQGTRPDAAVEARWATQREAIDAAAEIVGDARQSDYPGGYGVVARVPLPAGTTLVDPTVLVVERPSDYARAHLQPYDYIAFGKTTYFQLRETALGHQALTFYCNEANHAGGTSQRPNLLWVAHRDTRGGGAQLSWKITRDVEAGEELLVDYAVA